MGSHATAMLGYGVLLNDFLVKKIEADNGYVDLEDLLVAKVGLTEPSRSDKQVYSEYENKKNELIKNCPAQLCSFGDHETKMYALVLKDSIMIATEKYPKIINFQNLQIEETKLTEFQEFCEQFQINGKAHWILMSRYD